MSSSYEHAIRLAERGFAVFPIRTNSKIPACPNGCANATADPVRIKELWRSADPLIAMGVADELESHLNVGIEARRSRLVLVDVDRKGERDGYQSLADLEKRYDKLPTTLRATTPNGGLHLYFRAPESESPPNIKDHEMLGAGIEVKSDNQYLVAAPSTIDGRTYAWIDEAIPIADCPGWLIDLCVEAAKPKQPPTRPQTQPSVSLVPTGDEAPATDGYEYSGKDVVDRYNGTTSIEAALEAHGYYHGTSPGFYRHPNGDTCDSVHILDGLSYHFGASDPLRGKGCGKDNCCFTAFGLLVAASYAGDFRAAVRSVSEQFGMSGCRRQQRPKGECPIDPDPLDQRQPAGTIAKGIRRKGLPMVRMSDVVEKPIEWLWPQMIPLGGLIVVAGEGETGKSTLVSEIVARLSKGGEWPDGSPCPQMTSLYIGVEEDLERVLKPRLTKMDANQSAIHYTPGKTVVRDGKEVSEPWTLADLEDLRNTLADNPDIRCIVLDPLGVYFGSGRDSYKDQEIQTLLQPISKLAQEYEVTVIAIAHLGKNETRSIRNRILGSVAIPNTARCVLGVVRDKTNRTRSYVGIVKCNLGGKRSSLGFSTAEGLIDFEEEVSIDLETFAKGAETDTRGPKADDLDRAKKIIEGLLPVNEWREATPILKACIAAGVCRDTAHRAAVALEVKIDRTPTFPSKSIWMREDDRPF